MKLSRRLQTVADLLPRGISLADVGADRGELSYYLLEQGKVTRAILSDSSRHSLERAKHLFGGTCYEQCVEFRHGPGLEVYRAGDADYAVMAGMGGRTIVKILEDSPSVLRSFQSIIIQAMGNSEEVRRCLERLRFCIDEEILLWEDGHFYTIIRSQPCSEKPISLTEEEIFAGPCLLKKKEPLLKDYLGRAKQDRKAVYDHLIRENQGKERQNHLSYEIDLIERIEQQLE
ncbi:MAG TPA: class I SAM-dependent methyltransferase [Firmicutes bacterium]|nr:class I SAM-dependent methyltransferase [Bacillota bacterium]